MADREKPKLLRVQVTNNDGTTESKTIRQDQIARRPRQRDALSPEQQAKADALFGRIGHVVGQHDEWINAFLHDSDPDAELGVWQVIADTVDELWQHSAAKHLLRAKVEQVVIAVSVGAVDIPAQVSGVTDQFVELARKTFEERCDGK